MRSAVFTLVFLAFTSWAQAEPRNYQQARFYFQWVPDDWTKYFRIDCGTSSGNYTRFNKTNGTSTVMNVASVLPRVNGIYYCVVFGANDSDPNDPLGDASNETCFSIQGNWVYPDECQ